MFGTWVHLVCEPSYRGKHTDRTDRHTELPITVQPAVARAGENCLHELRITVWTSIW